jgi:hypothetical protein
MKTNFLKLTTVIVVLILSLSANISGQNKVLFMGKGTLGTHAADQDLYDKLPTWGFSAEYTETLPEDAKSYNGYVGVFINETIGSSSVIPFSTANYPIPCVCLEGWSVLSSRWPGWVKDAAKTDATDWDQHSGAGVDGQSIIIRDDKHYITKGYKITQNVAWSNSTVENTVANTNPVSFKEVDRKYSAKLAQAKSQNVDGYWTMITVDSAEAGFPNRMFIWGIVSYGVEGGDPFTEHAETDDYFRILQRACEWAFKGEGTTSGIETPAQDNFFDVYPNPCTDAIIVRYNASGKEKEIKAALNDITGKELTSRIALIDSNGYYFISFDVKDCPAGIYLVTLQAGDEKVTKKIMKE